MSILLSQESNVWVAQCLEYDVVAQGNSKGAALDSLEHTLIGQSILDIQQGKYPFEDISKAPKIYWDKFNANKTIEVTII